MERGLPHTLKSPIKKLTSTFVHFVISLQSRLYTLAPISVFYVDIYSSSLGLFKIDLVVGLNSISNPSTIFYFSAVLAVTLASRYICFEYLDCVKKAILQGSDIAKRLGIKVFVIL